MSFNTTTIKRLVSSGIKFKFLIVVSLFANITFGKNYYVSTSGSDSGGGSVSTPFLTIGKAATLVVAGDTVFVSGGTYIEQGIKPANSGTESAMIVFKPVAGSGDVILKHPGTALKITTSVFDLVSRNYICIEGFRFKDFLYGKACINITGSKCNVIINNRFENIGNSKSDDWDKNSIIWIYQSTQNVVRNNYFNNITGDGISLNADAKYNLVSDNTFIKFFGKLRNWGGTTLFSRAIDVQDETYGNNVIAFNYASNLINFIWLDRDGSSNVMLRNVARNSAGLLFNESRCAKNLIQENIAYGCQTGYQTARYSGTGRTYDARWINNIAYNNSTGFYIDRSMRDEFRNNIAYNNTSYNIVYTDSAQGFGPHIFQNNLWFTENKTNSVKLGATAVSVAKFQSDADVNETGGLSVNPLFTNKTSGSEDFTLQSSSPAKNAGDMGVSMGAYAVYDKTSVGWDSTFQTTRIQVYFDSVVSEAERGKTVELKIRLNKAATEQVKVDVVPVAGDARNGNDFSISSQTVTFEPGETTKSFFVSIVGISDHDELVAFRFANLINAKAVARNVQLVRIAKSAITTNVSPTEISKGIINIYPNPVTDVLNIKLSGATSKIRLYNNQGQELLAINASQNTNAIGMDKYPSGVYFIKIESMNETTVRKVIRKKD